MINIEDKNVEVGAGGQAGKAKEYVPIKPKIVETKNEDNVDIDRDKEYKNTETKPTIHKEINGKTEEEGKIVNQAEKIAKIADIFQKNNLDPKKYATEMKNLANRVGQLDEKTIMEIMKSNAKIENDMDEMMKIPKKIRNSVKSIFTGSSKKDTPA